MQDKTLYSLHANICKALANSIRIEIIDLLNDRELSFRELQQVTGTLKSNLSQHLSLMVGSGILVQRKEGLNAYYKLATPKIGTACSLMREVLIENIKRHNDFLNNLEK